MPKVTGPLFALDARNALGKAIVYSYWKGVNYVRARVIPANPRSDNQAVIRTYLGAVGKTTKMIHPTSDLGIQILDVTPGDQSWASYFGKTSLGGGNSSIIAALAAYAGLGSAAKALWATGAAAIPLTGFDVGYGVVDPVTGPEQLFVAATAAFALGLGIAATDPVGWDATAINAFAAAFAAAS